MGSRITAGEAFAAVVFASYATVLLAHRAPLSLTDLGNWTYQGVLLREHLLGHADAAHVLKHYPVPNSLETIGLGLLAWVLPWGAAAKTWVLLEMALAFCALRVLGRAVSMRPALWLVVPQAVFFNVNFWYGFHAFELGLCWVMLVATLLLRGAVLEWLLGALLVLAFFTHMIPFAFCGLLVLAYVWQTGRLRLLWQIVPAAGLSVWYLAGRFLSAHDADGQAGMAASVRDYSVAFWAFKVNSYLKSLGFVNPGAAAPAELGRIAFVGLFALDVVLAGIVAWWLGRSAREAFRERSERRFLWAAIAAVLPVAVLAPGAALGVSDPGARLLQVALALGLPLCTHWAGWRGRVAGACGVGLTMAGIWLFVLFGAQPRYDEMPKAGKMPRWMAQFAHVPNDDQDYLYGLLDLGEYDHRIFPTGLFLNTPAAKQ